MNADTTPAEPTPGRMTHASLMGTITIGFRDVSIFHCGLGLRHGNYAHEQEANARRLTAAWNACRHMTTEQIEALVAQQDAADASNSHASSWEVEKKALLKDAFHHLDEVLNGARTHHEQQTRDAAARKFLDTNQ